MASSCSSEPLEEQAVIATSSEKIDADTLRLIELEEKAQEYKNILLLKNNQNKLSKTSVGIHDKALELVRAKDPRFDSYPEEAKEAFVGYMMPQAKNIL